MTGFIMLLVGITVLGAVLVIILAAIQDVVAIVKQQRQ